MSNYRQDDGLSFSEIEIFNHVIEMLYLDDSDESIENALARLKELVYFDSAFFYIIERIDGETKIWKILMPGIDKYMSKKYLEEFFPLDDTLEIVSSETPIAYRSSDMFDREQRNETVFYKSFLEPVGIEYSIEENLSVNNRTCFGGLAIHRSRLHRDFDEKEMQIIKLLRPHLANLVERLYNNKDNLIIDSGSSSISKAKKVAYCLWNSRVEMIEGNIRDRNFIHEEDVPAILQTIQSQIIREKRERNNTNESEYRSIVSVNGKVYYLDILHHSSDGENDECIISLLYDFNSIFEGIIDYHCQDGSLTKREAEIVQLVIRGMSGSEIAEHLSVEESTVKSHLNHIYSKFQIEGKHQLLSAVMGFKAKIQL